MAFPYLTPIVGSRDGTGVQIDKRSTTYQTSFYRSDLYKIGDKFSIIKIEIPLVDAVAANQTLSVQIVSNSFTTTTTLATVNSTNYPNGERTITLYPAGLLLRNNFVLDLTFSGTSLMVVGLPIKIIVQLL